MVDPNSRLGREQGSREATERPKMWQPPQTLPSPNPVDGIVFRWIRTSLMGQNDPTNASAKMREGWEPCKATDHPELALTAASPNGNIEIGGLMLCRTSKEIMDQRDAYYRRSADSQMAAVDNSFMQAEDKRMPLFSEKKSTVTFGRGNK